LGYNFRLPGRSDLQHDRDPLTLRTDETPMLDLIRSFRLQIDAEDKSPKTIDAYTRGLTAGAEQHGLPLADAG